MDFFSQLYLRILSWAESKYAIYYLSVVSTLEACVLPYPPPDVLLAPMSLKAPHKAYYFAFITTIFSVIGGLVGYFLGEILLQFLLGYDLVSAENIKTVEGFFEKYGFWVVGVAAFSPIPYKLATISAGTMGMALLPFILISFIARGARYFLVASLVKAYGDKCDRWLQKYIDRLGYILIVVIIIGAWYAS